MNTERTTKFRNILDAIMEASPRAWVYLPSDNNWSLESESAILESEEVPPELEDDPDAGVPQFAKLNHLVQAIPVTSLQDVVCNARSQKPDVTPEDLFMAFKFFYGRDAFIIF